MHRSASTSRFSDEYYHPASAATGKGSSPASHRSPAMELPTYDPQSDAGKKEVARARVSEGMVHLIPLILLLCAMVLWFFSHPEIDVVASRESDSIVARIKNMTLEGYSNWNGSSMTTGLEDLDPMDGIGVDHHKDDKGLPQ